MIKAHLIEKYLIPKPEMNYEQKNRALLEVEPGIGPSQNEGHSK
jgi:hypothetical protein